ncbi:quercetin 2,3-dioxygenase [Azospirillum formosense]|uniref:Quercetin 2,3-dioxygenase n=1 Tax=Azospirillum formosense TaxID=861533 RepID=A0ABX2L1B4_9PROT|nr:pirin family protein [Azospirillum formosense]MBY3752001.1 pirin family protein [Azospirillum formosense]NUB22674.1 quercetin 2,3-dioxygenase [Azospirillum formosense]
MTAETVRPVLTAVEGMEASDGAGVRMTRMVGTPRLRMLDPFLMLDYFGSDTPQDYLAGFPDHPHRGFETVTYMLAGRMRHWDNHGHEGVIETGGVQWMTAGRGVIHSEMPEQTEGLMKGFQLWINLQARLKMSEPAYQEFAADRIPVETREGGTTVTVIAGTTGNGTAGPVRSGSTEARYFDVTLPAGAAFSEPVPAGHTAALVVFEGSVVAPGSSVRLGGPRVLVLGEGDRAEITAGPSGARFLLLSGRPIGEPVAWGGPFVMNSREEVMQAYRDYEEGKF